MFAVYLWPTISQLNVILQRNNDYFYRLIILVWLMFFGKPQQNVEK